jgi:hypothetical protein
MKNDVTLHDGCAIIHLTLPDGRRRDAVVDAEDFDKVKNYRWHARRNAVASESVPSAWYVRARHARLHRLVTGTLDAGRGVHVQHLNEDTFDNRKANLRVGSHFENMQLRCGRVATGVGFNKDKNKFTAQIKYAGRLRHLGSFKAEADALAAYEPFRQARLADPSCDLPWEAFKAKVLHG